MPTVLTTPIPFLEPGEKLSATNRIASQLRNALPDFPGPEQPSTFWSSDLAGTPVQTRQAKFEPMYIEMYNVIVAFVMQARKAEANDQSTRPILLQEFSRQNNLDLRCGQWFIQVNSPRNPTAAQDTLSPSEERRTEPEFTWSSALYRARKAAQEFSENTHADH